MLIDLYVMAVRCDLTRYGSFMLGQGSGSDEGLASSRVVGLPQGAPRASPCSMC